MLLRLLKNDLRRNKAVSATLFLFVFLAALLAAAAVGLVGQLLGSLDQLFTAARVPHFVQMHSGDLDQAAIDAFALGNESVAAQQTVEILNIAGAQIFLGANETSEAASIIENSFVTQNEAFDWLLDTAGERITLQGGEVGVPIYHMQQYGLELGDPVRIVSADFELHLTIAAFVRDAQMNTSIVTSKRFLLSGADWQTLQANLGESEYLIEFRLHDEADLAAFESAYLAAGLPQNGPSVTAPLYRLMNGLSDGILAAVIVLMSLLLLVIAALCLRLTLLATLEEDYREIGVLKALGLPARQISRLYLTKYLALTGLACLAGYLAALPLGALLRQNIALYLGLAPQSGLLALLPLLAVLLIALAVVGYCRFVLHRFGRVTALAALQSGLVAVGASGGKRWRLSQSHLPYLNFYLGLREAARRLRFYGLLCFVFMICMFLIVVPLNFRNTLNSPSFIRYLGSGQSNLRIDLPHSPELAERFAALQAGLAADADVARQATFVTCAYQVENADGQSENLKVEIGDFTVFPLAYTSGRAPQNSTEIALSALNAEELAKQVGDPITVLVAGEPHELTVSGIYQDVTNGGKTAKAQLAYEPAQILWYQINLDLAPGVDLDAKIAAYTAAYPWAKVTGLADYIQQTLGSLQSQLARAVGLAVALALLTAVLITALFLKLLLVKEAKQNAIQRCLGFSLGAIRRQYLSRLLVVLCAGVVLGTLLAAWLGPGLGALLLTGASNLQFVVNPWQAYLLCPLALAAAVSLTTLLASCNLGERGSNSSAQPCSSQLESP